MGRRATYVGAAGVLGELARRANGAAEVRVIIHAHSAAVGESPSGKERERETVLQLVNHREALCEKKVKNLAKCYSCNADVRHEDNAKRCSRCMESFYCSTACQRQHWNAGHKH